MHVDASIVDALRRAPNRLWLRIDKLGEIVYNLPVGERVQRRHQFYVRGHHQLPVAGWLVDYLGGLLSPLSGLVLAAEGTDE